METINFGIFEVTPETKEEQYNIELVISIVQISFFVIVAVFFVSIIM